MNVRHLHDLQVGDNKSLKTTERDSQTTFFLPISINKENLLDENLKASTKLSRHFVNECKKKKSN